VEIYSKTDCHLCEEAKEILRRVQREIPFELTEIDISGESPLFEHLKEDIPVVFINGRKAFKYRIDEGKLRRRLRRGGK